MKAYMAMSIEDGMPITENGRLQAFANRVMCQSHCHWLKAKYDIDAEVAEIDITE